MSIDKSIIKNIKNDRFRLIFKLVEKDERACELVNYFFKDFFSDPECLNEVKEQINKERSDVSFAKNVILNGKLRIKLNQFIPNRFGGGRGEHLMGVSYDDEGSISQTTRLFNENGSSLVLKVNSFGNDLDLKKFADQHYSWHIFMTHKEKTKTEVFSLDFKDDKVYLLTASHIPYRNETGSGSNRQEAKSYIGTMEEVQELFSHLKHTESRYSDLDYKNSFAKYHSSEITTDR
ncbi:MAG: hypothetical protein AB7S44_03090 [Spirochaetales bacterium]